MIEKRETENERAMMPAVERTATNERIAGIQRRYTKVPRSERKAGQLPPYVMIALAMHDTQGMSWAEVAEKMGRSRNSLAEFAASPAAREYRARLKEIVDDPVQVARLSIQAGATGLALQGLLLYEAALKAGNFAEAGKQLRANLEIAGLLGPKNGQVSVAPAVIQINLQGAAFTTEMQHGDSEATKVIEAEAVD